MWPMFFEPLKKLKRESNCRQAIHQEDCPEDVFHLCRPLIIGPIFACIANVTYLYYVFDEKSCVIIFIFFSLLEKTYTKKDLLINEIVSVYLLLNDWDDCV